MSKIMIFVVGILANKLRSSAGTPTREKRNRHPEARGTSNEGSLNNLLIQFWQGDTSPHQVRGKLSKFRSSLIPQYNGLFLRGTLFTMLLFATILNINAQQSLSLSQAIERSLKNNYDIILQQEKHKIPEKNNTILNAGFFPVITAGMNFGDRYASMDNSENPFTFFRDDPETKTGSFSTQPFVEMNWVLFNGLRAFANKNRLALLEEQSFGNTSIVIENTVQAVILSYYDAVLQKEKLNVLSQVKQLSKDKYTYFLDRKQTGIGTTFEVLQVKNAYLTDSINYLNQEVVVKASLRDLQLLLGENNDVFYNLTDGFDMVFNALSLTQLESDMMQNNANLKNQFINESLLKENTKIQEGGKYPTLAAQVGTNYNYTGTRVHGLPQKAKSKTLNYYFNFSLQFTLFNGGATLRAIENAQVQETVAKIGTEQMQQSLRKNLYNVYDAYNAGLKTYNVNSEAVQDVLVLLQTADDKFKIGSISSFDYRDVQMQYLNTQFMLIQNIYFLTEHKANLLKLTGGILSE